MKFRIASVLTATLLSVGLAQAATELVIATVNNGHMIEMQKLSKNFEAANPDIKLKWVTLEEGVLRQRVTTDTRKSTYANVDFLKAARFAKAEKTAIDSANPNDATLPKSPYVGVQFAAIPEFQAIGIAVGQQMSAALAGKTSVDEALKASQVAADREMKKAGYYK